MYLDGLRGRVARRCHYICVQRRYACNRARGERFGVSGDCACRLRRLTTGGRSGDATGLAQSALHVRWGGEGFRWRLYHTGDECVTDCHREKSYNRITVERKVSPRPNRGASAREQPLGLLVGERLPLLYSAGVCVCTAPCDTDLNKSRTATRVEPILSPTFSACWLWAMADRYNHMFIRVSNDRLTHTHVPTDVDVGHCIIRGNTWLGSVTYARQV